MKSMLQPEILLPEEEGKRKRGKIHQMAYKERSVYTSQQRIQSFKPSHLGELPLTLRLP